MTLVQVRNEQKEPVKEDGDMAVEFYVEINIVRNGEIICSERKDLNPTLLTLREGAFIIVESIRTMGEKIVAKLFKDQGRLI